MGCFWLVAAIHHELIGPSLSIVLFVSEFVLHSHSSVCDAVMLLHLHVILWFRPANLPSLRL